VSLDSCREEEHDRARGCKGAYRAALRAIELFLSIPGMHVSVSAVLPPGLLLLETAEQFLEFLRGLGIHEAWLSEAKPAVAACQKEELIITSEQRAMLMTLQDRCNREGGMTVNYLGHFEDGSHFGCSAGKKMVYVDAFGEVSPCVFIPMTFGNVQRTPLREIYSRMAAHFPGEKSCFINRNYHTLQTFRPAGSPVIDAEATRVMDEITFGPQARFFELQYH
ncbi:MAG TPA: SPASM domain-containing protein, partial [bacterium]|nr:SPASM domain-containing protein [bacterium]